MLKNYFEKRNKFVCPKCGHSFEVTKLLTWINAPHLFDILRWFKCPECGKRSWMKKVKK